MKELTPEVKYPLAFYWKILSVSGKREEVGGEVGGEEGLPEVDKG